MIINTLTLTLLVVNWLYTRIFLLVAVVNEREAQKTGGRWREHARSSYAGKKCRKTSSSPKEQSAEIPLHAVNLIARTRSVNGASDNKAAVKQAAATVEPQPPSSGGGTWYGLTTMTITHQRTHEMSTSIDHCASNVRVRAATGKSDNC